jgi:hypothetical protein
MNEGEFDPNDYTDFPYFAIYATSEGLWLEPVGGHKKYARITPYAEDCSYHFDWTWRLPDDAVEIWKSK